MKFLLSRRMLLVISLLANALFCFVTFRSGLIPLKYLIPLFIILFAIVFALYRGEKDKDKEHTTKIIIYKLINIILSGIMLFLSLMVIQGTDFISSVTGGKEQIIEMNVAVLKTSSYQELDDLKDKKFGGNNIDSVNVNKAETMIEEDIGLIDVQIYKDYNELIQALQNKDVEAAIIKDIDMESLDDLQDGFTDQIKVIHTVEIKIPKIDANSAKVTQEPFHILISGTDKEGPIDTFALSDVNMLATINPTTKQVLLTSIPRDYYVDIVGMDNVSGKDKLTHSAKGGMQCTLSTVEELLGIKINYYAKFNFTSFINVVDALGGVEVNVPQYRVIGRDDGVFTTKKGNHGQGYQIKPGQTKMDADMALAFVRERKSFVLGDDIRGKNQMLVLKAIIKKCCSPAIITKMDSLFQSLENSFETNMSAKEVQSLINMEISDMAPWDVQSYRLDGDSTKKVFSFATIGDIRSKYPNGLYVTTPYDESLQEAKGYIEKIMNNEIVKVNEN